VELISSQAIPVLFTPGITTSTRCVRLWLSSFDQSNTNLSFVDNLTINVDVGRFGERREGNILKSCANRACRQEANQCSECCNVRRTV